MKSILKSIGIFIFALFSLTACDSGVLYEENLACEDNVWKYEDIKQFEFDVTDTLSPVNLFINMRTTTDYPYSNIYMFLYSTYPGDEERKDTLEFKLAETDGKWLGENSGTVVEFQGLISTGGRFARAGTYIFKLQHGMRENDLAEIIDVGFKVELMEQ
jgi:gliding motility-associated lipoprotein GldH